MRATLRKPRPSLTQQTQLKSQDELKDHLLKAVYRCMDKIGVSRMTIQDIANEASVSRPTVYKYLGNKEQIIDEISEIESLRVQTAVRTKLKHASRFEETLTNALMITVEEAIANPYLVQIQETLDFPSEAMRPDSGYNRKQKIWWGALIQRAMASGDIADDLTFEDVIEWLTSSLHLLMTKQRAAGTSRKALIRFTQRFVVRPIIAQR